MFYEKLAEAKEDKKQGLSLGQKAGVAGAGLAGAATPALGAVYSKPTSAFNKFLEDSKYSRKADALRIQSQDLNNSYQKRLAPIQEEINKLHDIKMDYFGQIAGAEGLEKQRLKVERNKLDELLREARKEYDTIDAEKHVKHKNISTGISDMSDRAFKVRRNKLLGTMGLAGVGTAFAAKKLFDRYNKRKQQSSQ